MKRNIDFTADRLFSHKPVSIPLFESNRIPWRRQHYHQQMPGPVITGTGRDRAIFKIMELDIRAMSGIDIPYCYRCGREIKLPWRRHQELCRECMAELGQPYGYRKYIPWRYPREGVINTTDPVVREMNRPTFL